MFWIADISLTSLTFVLFYFIYLFISQKAKHFSSAVISCSQLNDLSGISSLKSTLYNLFLFIPPIHSLFWCLQLSEWQWSHDTVMFCFYFVIVNNMCSHGNVKLFWIKLFAEASVCRQGMRKFLTLGPHSAHMKKGIDKPPKNKEICC